MAVITALATSAGRVLATHIGKRPFFIDFTPTQLLQCLNEAKSGVPLLPKAVGAQRPHQLQPLRVLDMTAGLGNDAFRLAAFGCVVTMAEHNEAVAALLRDGLQRGRARRDAAAAIVNTRMALLPWDGADIVLRHAALFDVSWRFGTPFPPFAFVPFSHGVTPPPPPSLPCSSQVAYLDPMFTARKKGLSRLAGQVLQQLCTGKGCCCLLTPPFPFFSRRAVVPEPSREADERLFRAAYASSVPRIVVKVTLRSLAHRVAMNIEFSPWAMLPAAAGVPTTLTPLCCLLQRERRAPSIVAKPQPTFTVAGKLIRFDVYDRVVQR